MGWMISTRARLVIFLLGAAVAVGSVLLAASSLEVLERGGESDDEDAALSPIELLEIGQPSAGAASR